MKIEVAKVIETIGRLIGRANSHKNAAKQTNDEKKREAHLLAAKDMFSLADLLASSTDNPEYAKSREAYRKNVR